MNEELVKCLQLPTSLTNDSLWCDLSETSQADFCGGSGLPTGKRIHKPLIVLKRIDKSTPLLAKALTEN